MTRFVGLLVSLALAPAAFGTFVFQDDFNGDLAGLSTTPTGWTVSDGTVDVVSNGQYGLSCMSGLCLDLDGSSENAGILTSNSIFNLAAGQTYTLSYFLSGNQRFGSDTVTVSFGGVSQTHTLASTAPYAQFSLLVHALTDSSSRIVFANAGGDNVGVLLDNVSLQSLDQASLISNPEPATFLLVGVSLVALAVRRRQQLIRK